MKRVGILYHPKLEKARPLAEELDKFLKGRGISSWICSAWEEKEAIAQVPGSNLILSVGGDGTILRAARASASWSVPIVGVNLGKLGFMTELNTAEVFAKLPQLLAGEGWIDDRAMLEATLLTQGQPTDKILYALNDVVVGRGRLARLVSVAAHIDGELVATYRVDGIIVATATGSTGYSLAAGGPILYPQSQEILLQPIASHFSFSETLVLSPETTIELKVATTHEAMLTIDGQVEIPLANGDGVRVKLGPNRARFLRLHTRGYFYSSLEQKLKGKRL